MLIRCEKAFVGTFFFFPMINGKKWKLGDSSTGVYLTKLSARIVLRKGEKQQFEENEDVIECLNFDS